MSDIDAYLEALKKQPFYSEHVRDDNTMDDTDVETHFRPLKYIQSAGPESQRYLRITMDDDPLDIETRVLYQALVALGWTPPAETFPIEREKYTEQPHF